MNIGHIVVKGLVAAGAVMLTAWHPEPHKPVFQGWVEANFVFVGADEIGRIESLAVREGDTIAAGAPLFTVDADICRRRECPAARRGDASTTRSRPSRARKSCSKPGPSNKKELRYRTHRRLHETEAQPVSARKRLTRRNRVGPRAGQRNHPAGLFPARAKRRRQDGLLSLLLPPGNVKLRFFVPEAASCRRSSRATPSR